MVIHEQMHMLCILPLMQAPYYIENNTFFTDAHSIQIFMG